MEACASAHCWGREIGWLGHAVRLIPPVWVKPAARGGRRKAALRVGKLHARAAGGGGGATLPTGCAIVPAASRPGLRPGMRLVAARSEDWRSRAMILPDARPSGSPANPARGRGSRGRPAEHGVTAAQGIGPVRALAGAVRDDQASLPPRRAREGPLGADRRARADASMPWRRGSAPRPVAARPVAARPAALSQGVPEVGPVTATASRPRRPVPSARRSAAHLARARPRGLAEARRDPLGWIGYCDLRSGDLACGGAVCSCRGRLRQGRSILVFDGVATRPWRRASGQAAGCSGRGVLGPSDRARAGRHRHGLRPGLRAGRADRARAVSRRGALRAHGRAPGPRPAATSPSASTRRQARLHRPSQDCRS